MKKEFLGIEGWIWLVGAVVVVGGYLYLRHQSSSSSQQQQAPAPVTTGGFTEWLGQHQGTPNPKHKKKQ